MRLDLSRQDGRVARLEELRVMDITTERVELPLAGGGSMGGYLARPVRES